MKNGIFLFGVGWLALCLTTPYPTNRNLALVVFSIGFVVCTCHFLGSILRVRAVKRIQKNVDNIRKSPEYECMRDAFTEEEEIPGALRGVVHELKTWPPYFKDIVDGRKTFEFRKNDRDFKIGDILRLREFLPPKSSHPLPGYTELRTDQRVTYIVPGGGAFGIPEGYCIMQLSPVKEASK